MNQTHISYVSFTSRQIFLFCSVLFWATRKAPEYIFEELPRIKATWAQTCNYTAVLFLITGLPSLNYKYQRNTKYREINPENSLGGLTLKLQYFGHMMQRADSLEKTLMLGKIECKRRRGCQGMVRGRRRWLDSITDSMDMNLSKFQEIVEDRGAWRAAVHGVTESWTHSDWTTRGTLHLEGERECQTPAVHYTRCRHWVKYCAVYWKHSDIPARYVEKTWAMWICLGSANEQWFWHPFIHCELPDKQYTYVHRVSNNFLLSHFKKIHENNWKQGLG